MSGFVDPIIEIQPLPAAFLSVYTDERKEQVLRIINHEEQPLKISGFDSEGTHFKASLKEVESGKIYELLITGPSGHRSRTI